MTGTTLHLETVRISLTRALGDNWWLFLLRGLVAIVFGVLAFVWPGMTLVALILLYGVFALADGVFALAAGILGGKSPVPRWWLVIAGLAGIVAGIVTFVWPDVTALVLVFFIAAWAITVGVVQIVGAIQLRKEIANEWLLVVSGALTMLFGVALFAAPGAGALALIWLIGAYTIAYGLLMIGFAFAIRSRARAL